MILSILIPVYEYDCRALVTELLQQGRALALPFELLLFDDGSREDIRSLHRPFGAEPEVDYREMPQNMGRAAIRNELARAASGRYLLFIDSDSRVVKPDYLSVYVEEFRPDTVVYGGRCYAADAPADPALYLHWYYGSKREAQPAFQRKLKPYHGFMTNNFCIPRNTFFDIGFDQHIRYYGHEDTLFGWELEQRKIGIIHLNNPVQHEGLEVNTVFIEKQEQAVENLRMLAARFPGLRTRLLDAGQFLSRYGLRSMFCYGLDKVQNALLKRLKSANPSLIGLDLLKLHWLLRH